MRILGAGRALLHAASDTQHVFAAHFFGGGECGGVVRVEDDLRKTIPVAQIDKDNPAVVAAAIHPATQRDGLCKLVEVELPAIMAAHERNSCFVLIGAGDDGFT